MPFTLESPAFDHNDAIPERYAVEGDNHSPPLRWRDPPKGARSFALLVEDPDAPSGLFRHWAVYNIDADQRSLREGVSSGDAAQAVNDFGNARYDGPKPPRGHGPHHYRFRLAALDTPEIVVPEQSNALQVWRKIEPHIIEETALVGVYETH